MSILLKGLSVSKGICIGKAILINKDGINYVPSFIKKSQTKSEVNKFAKSLSNIKKEYKKNKKEQITEQMQQFVSRIGVLVEMMNCLFKSLK